ncbi:putative GPI anchored protein [Aspergillus thermomutatus]|uniref:Uncharacterized protein n=1 Tax=Aspergillus thermomutatus TaxID=41047 RepID=A0A397GH92_ASPTH|nr:uncharacterized protein CDV56_105972 [Aspergillus thermomutatus]RHZ48383.1 hypothetical protein CDV56_105972 [Aspergillus thermomutatus]
MLLSLVTVTAILQLAVATNLSPPILYSRHGSQHGSLEKRWAAGSQNVASSRGMCLSGVVGISSGGPRPFFVVGYQGVGVDVRRGCTGEATRVTVHTPYSTLTLGAMTEVSATATGTTTTEQMFTAISATASATTTTTSRSRSESESTSHSHSRVSASSSSAGSTSTSTSVTEAETETTTTASTPTTTARFSQSSSSPNNNGGSSAGVGLGIPVLAEMVALGAVLL